MSRRHVFRHILQHDQQARADRRTRRFAILRGSTTTTGLIVTVSGHRNATPFALIVDLYHIRTLLHTTARLRPNKYNVRERFQKLY
jgi:hypothetical protein